MTIMMFVDDYVDEDYDNNKNDEEEEEDWMPATESNEEKWQRFDGDNCHDDV